MRQTISSIVANKQLAENCWEMTLDSPQIATEVRPGQFVNVRIRQTNDPLFRRPFSVSRCVMLDNGTLGMQIVYRVVGKGTMIMATLKEGDQLDIIGPLGHGFEIAKDKKNQIVIAGGMGSAGLLFLAEEISRSVGNQGKKLTIMLGAQSKAKILLEDEFRKLNGNLLICTDDGTSGYSGSVIEMLHEFFIKEKSFQDCTIYACGPEPMFKALHIVCQQYNIAAQVSMERNMLCGIGACLVCVCKVKKSGVFRHRDINASHIQFLPDKELGYALVCKDGPVFNIDEVTFEDQERS